VTERKIIVKMQSDEKPKPFWDRHFTPVLTLVGVFIAAVLAMSESAQKFLINQPPDVKIMLVDPIVTQVQDVYARAVASDYDSPREDLHYRWEMYNSNKALSEGDGPDFSLLKLPTHQPGKFTVLVTVTDKRGSGKYRTSDASYQVSPQSVSTTPPDLHLESVETDDILSLDAPTTIDWSKQQHRKIVTNGYNLKINGESLDKNKKLTIVAFETPANRGADGSAGLPGVNGGQQQSGGAGQPGERGSPSAAGKHAETINIALETDLGGTIEIDNSGQPSGDGGSGGPGGPGGSGGQGTPSRSGILDCNSGPGFSGSGGDGGRGGDGGQGGNGGNAGVVIFSSKARVPSASIRIYSRGGAPGKPGPAGSGGDAGAGGPEGETGGFCRSSGRTGKSGIWGAPGNSGNPGFPGNPALISVKVGEKQDSVIREFSIE
jgi:hypothetical protein